MRGTRLVCLCGNPDCPAAGTDAAAAAVIIHVLADTAPTPQWDRELHTPIPAPEPTPAPAPATPTPVGFVQSGAVIPPTMLADLVARGAKVTPLAHPDELHAVETYRPPAAMARLVRMRYLRCSFPGCDHPATGCDLDHGVPWPAEIGRASCRERV